MEIYYFAHDYYGIDGELNSHDDGEGSPYIMVSLRSPLTCMR